MKKPNADHGQPQTLTDLMRSFSDRNYRAKGDSEHQWPASRLTQKEMTSLRRISNRIGRPVNQLILESVEVYVHLMEHESLPDHRQQENPPIVLDLESNVACSQVMPENESDTKETLENIHTQLQLLNDTLDGLQSDIQWALRNLVHHLAEPNAVQPQQSTARSNDDQHAMLLLRDLIGAPELQQSEISDSTRVILERILHRISPSNAPKPQEHAKVAEEEGGDESSAAKQPVDTFAKSNQEENNNGLLF